jgi:phage terminase small subunit
VLTNKQRQFISEYTTNGFNATAAAKTAGYKGNDKSLPVSGVQVLKSTKVKAEIDRILAKRERKDEDKQQKLVKFLEETIEGKNAKGIQLKATELLMKYYGMLVERRITEDATRERELDEAQEAEARRLAAIRLRDAG